MNREQIILVEDPYDYEPEPMSREEYDITHEWLEELAHNPGGAIQYWDDLDMTEKQILKHAESTLKQFEYGYPQYSGDYGDEE